VLRFVTEISGFRCRVEEFFALLGC